MRQFCIAVVLLLVIAGYADASNWQGEGNKVHVDIGLAYTTGAEKMYNAVKDNVDIYGQQLATQEGGAFDSSGGLYIPVGLKLDVYYLFNFGLGIGVNAGPVSIGAVDFNNIGSNSTDIYGEVPVGADVRYVFINPSNFLPYARVGVRYPITFGSNEVSGATPGLFAGAGVYFVPWHLGIEVEYDGSTIDAGYHGLTESIHPNELMVEIYAHI